jgi:epsilon-lactone hydrolase
MAMGSRPEVETAATPIVVLDVLLGVPQVGAAIGRAAMRHPFRGKSTKLSNLSESVVREVTRSFMGFTSSLCISEFRSLELVLDRLCKVVMPPIVHSFNVIGVTTEFGDVPGVLYLPRELPPLGVILYLHGGGYIGTSPNMYGLFIAQLCRETECAVFVADYRLAPEFPYPAAAEDASGVYGALISRGIPAPRIFLAGDSGGGGLANTLLVEESIDSPRVKPAGLVLFSPEVDLRLADSSITDNAKKDILPWNIPTASYLRGADLSDPALSPLTTDLSYFPPTCVTWGGDEMFRDPIRRYVQRLKAEGVVVESREYEGMFHAFQILMPWTVASHDAFKTVRRFIHNILNEAEPLNPFSIRSQLGIPD